MWEVGYDLAPHRPKAPGRRQHVWVQQEIFLQ
jgi:hypothetical protein